MLSKVKIVNKHNSGCKVECIKNKNQAFHLQKLYRKYNLNNTDLFPSPQIGGCVATQINDASVSMQALENYRQSLQQSCQELFSYHLAGLRTLF